MNASAAAPQMRSITEQVADALRQRIRDQGLQPGDRLGNVDDLARTLGVSRPTMREALRLLSSGGLLRSARGPGGGTFVQRSAVETLSHSLAERISAMLDIDAVSLTELVHVRIALEVPVTRLAAERIEQRTLDELRASLEAFDAPAASDDDRLAANTAFHRTIARAAGNPLLAACVDWAFLVVQPRLYAAIAPNQLDHQHAAVVDALAARDPDGAADAMRRHLEDVARIAELRDGDMRSAGQAAMSVSSGGAPGLAARLQRHIQHEALRPGDRLGREDDLIAAFSTSRSVLREAVQILAAGHLLRVVLGPGGGIFVANSFVAGIGTMMSESVLDLLHYQDLTNAQLLEARIAIEPSLAAAASRAATPANLAVLRAAIAERGAFHRALAAMVPGTISAAITSWMFDVQEPQLQQIIGTDREVRLGLHQHEQLYDAVAAGDAQRASAVMREHLLLLTTGA